MSNADLLRRAAEKLREYAGRASRGPWDASADGLVWPARLGDPACGSSSTEDAEYIALMHPPVTLALADLLDGYAEWFDLPPFTGFKNGTDERFIALARAVLREEAS